MDTCSPVQQGFLIGTLTKVYTNSKRSCIEFRMVEQFIKEEEDAEPTTSNQLVHRIKFSGNWCRYIIQDLETTHNLKIDLNAYDPEFNTTIDRWEFRQGVRAELLLARPGASQPPFFLKKIDIAPRLSSDLPEPALKAEPTTPPKSHAHLNAPPSSQASSANMTAPRPLRHENPYPPSPSTHPQDSSPAPTRQNTHKRVRTHSRESSPPTHTPLPDIPNSSHASCPPANTNSHAPNVPPPVHIAAPSPSPRLQSTPTPATFSVTPSIQPLKKCPMMTLAEIEKMDGGQRTPFSVMAIIDEKKTEECERTVRGTQDYKMTLYLIDSSRPLGSRNVTCNLFWKTEQDCPVWGKAEWRVVVLFNVYKRASTIYDTQIIGPAAFFQWALWAPAFTGSAEQLHSSNKILPQFASLFDLSLDELKARAAALYELHQQNSVPDEYAQFAGAHPLSVPKTISELGIGSRQKFDLCVEVLDVWIADLEGRGGNDRITVTDYTCNRMLRSVKPSEEEFQEENFGTNPSAAVQLHTSHGGTHANWRVTESRVLTVYIAPPILRAIYAHFLKKDNDGGTEEDLRGMARNPNEYDYRDKLAGKVVRLSQLELCVGAGSAQTGLIYALMPNPYNPRGSRPEEISEPDPDRLALLANRIVPVSPSEPAYRKLQHDRARYRQELDMPPTT
ncbi:hypothetical protein PCASD_00875 [Puccinia coronata f. sp. avenae]|uniref:Telomeric single stranded DNA binding POT1/Cdc13 domain-containing protein n=1 Tax=Puccinia coronata f. sp. avenae TaxID=200324 RepID=A0A2N5VPK1_9BASI|nr:hypothetical protein PCASD_00875 [Puccinia coronata f. sp. avenae]